MPTYQYSCTACGERLEVVQRFTDDPLTDCPACAGRLRKVFSPVGVVFKGSGFYRTDSRATAGAASPNGSGGADGGTESGQSRQSRQSKDGKSAPGSPNGTTSDKPVAKEAVPSTAKASATSTTAA